MNGQKSIWGREKKGVAGQNSDAGGNSMASGVEITGERVIWPTGLGFLIQEHRENERVKGKSPRQIRRPKERLEAAVTMAGGKSSSAHLKTDIQATKCQGKWSGRERGERGFSPRGKRRRRRLGDGGSRGEAGGGFRRSLGAAVTSCTGDARGRKER